MERTQEEEDTLSACSDFVHYSGKVIEEVQGINFYIVQYLRDPTLGNARELHGRLKGLVENTSGSFEISTLRLMGKLEKKLKVLTVR